MHVTNPESASPVPARPNLINFARQYAEQGRPVFPCNPWNKQPLTPHGFKDATTDQKQLEKWWAEHPNAIIGSPTGSATNTVVIDIDSERAEEELQVLAEQADASLPPTYTVKTHDGKHLYFQYPQNAKVGCRDRNMPGQVNVRGDGGYVIVPPSKHPAGSLYHVIDHSAKAPLPAWLLKILISAPDGETLALKEVTPRWAWQKFNRELARLRRATTGERNNVLNDTVWWAARLSDHPLLKDRRVFDELVELGIQIGLDEREVRSTANSGWHAGLHSKLTILPIHECTDLGNADRFVLRCGDRVRYVKAYGSNGWLLWDGRRWKPDAKSEVRKIAHDTVRAIYQETATVQDDDLRKRLAAWAVRSESAAATMALLEQSYAYVAVDPTELDADAELLNLENGTLDLRTGQVREQRQADLITRMIPVRYEPRASCPTFEKHIATVLPDEGVREYFREMIAYHLSGSTAEQCVHVLYGGGSNGKSTTADLFRNLAGDYGTVVKRTFFAIEGYTDVAPYEVADLLGRRIVTCSEFEEGDVLRIALMKALTSGQSSRVKACRKYGHPFEFEPRVKFLLDSNYQLKVDSPDHGTWRRIRVIPFTQTISGDAKDLHFADKLWAERSGVLNWIIEGLRRWNQRGRVLEIPVEVKNASSAYEKESDLLKQFLDEQCVPDAKGMMRLDAFTREYREWAQHHTNRRRSMIGRDEIEKRLSARGIRVVYDEKLRARTVLGLASRALSFEAMHVV